MRSAWRSCASAPVRNWFSYVAAIDGRRVHQASNPPLEVKRCAPARSGGAQHSDRIRWCRPGAVPAGASRKGVEDRRGLGHPVRLARQLRKDQRPSSGEQYPLELKGIDQTTLRRVASLSGQVARSRLQRTRGGLDRRSGASGLGGKAGERTWCAKSGHVAFSDTAGCRSLQWKSDTSLGDHRHARSGCPAESPSGAPALACRTRHRTSPDASASERRRLRGVLPRRLGKTTEPAENGPHMPARLPHRAARIRSSGRTDGAIHAPQPVVRTGRPTPSP